MRKFKPVGPPSAGASPEARFRWWRRLLDQGPTEATVLCWVEHLRVARDGLRSAYRPHIDGLTGIDRRDPRRTLRARQEAEQWGVDVQDETGRIVEQVPARDREDAVMLFFWLHDGRVAPALPGGASGSTAVAR